MIKQLASGRWVVDYRDVTGRRRRKTFATKKSAERAERHYLSERDEGRLPEVVTPTLADFIPEWTAETRSALRHNTWRNYATHVDRHILPVLGNVRIAQIDSRRLQQFVAGLAEGGMSPMMIRRVFATLSVILTHASLSGYCAPPTKRGLRFPSIQEFVSHAPTVSDIERLADAIDARFYALVILCGYCGLRQGEALALHPRDIEWDRHRIRVHQTLERGTQQMQPRTKSGKPRYVTLPARVEEALRIHMAEYPNALIVFHRDGRLVEPTWLHHEVWHPARVACGLPDVRFHDLRHAAATVMAELGGWGPKKVQTELGHSTAAFTLDRYGHLWAESDETRREQLDEAIASALGGSRTRTTLRPAAFEAAPSTSSGTSADSEDTP